MAKSEKQTSFGVSQLPNPVPTSIVGILGILLPIIWENKELIVSWFNLSQNNATTVAGIITVALTIIAALIGVQLKK